MGWRYEVHAWVRRDGQYAYEAVYQGQSLLAAIRAMVKAKRTAGCVRLEWRAWRA